MIHGSGFIAHIEGCGPQGCCAARDSSRRAEGIGLLLAKGCERIAAVTHSKQNHPRKLSAITSI